jgi:hypothetical protein
MRQQLEESMQVKIENDTTQTPSAKDKGGNPRSLPATLQPKSLGNVQGTVGCIDIDVEPPKKKLMRHSGSSSSDKFKAFESKSGWKPRRSANARS